MKLKLGIIGEEHSAAIIEEVLLDYEEFDSSIFLDTTEDSSISIIEAHQEAVDTWLVFDQINYHKIMAWGKAKKPVYYIPYRGASFFKVLCELLYKHYQIEEVSIDTIPYEDVRRGINEMNISWQKINCLKDNGELTLHDYIAYHKKMFASGETRAAVTRSYFIKKTLEAEGIPAFCVLPIRVSIRNILNMILSEEHIKQAINSQIAVQVFDFDLYGNEYDYYSVDDLYAREITLMKKLIEYSKKIKGSLKSAGQGRFFVFTTRGVLKECTDDFRIIPAYKELEELKKDLCACGIGLGTSASEAEFNAVVALRQAKESGLGNWFARLENKKSVGPLGKENLTAVDLYSEELLEISKKTSLSISTLSKIKSMMKTNDSDHISAQELALALTILPRSARRILQQLAGGGVAAEIGLESPGMKGRPKKVFKILF